jgi:hypothetical protein
MFRQRFARFLDRFDQRVIEFLILKMRAHGIDEALPELFAALFMNRFVANHGEFVRTRRHEDKHSVAFLRSVHAELMESFGRGGERIAVQFPALHINTNLPRCFRFCVSDRSNDTIVLEFTEEFFRPHDVTSSSLRPLHQSFRRRREIR